MGWPPDVELRLYRISNHANLIGEGGLRASGRWHTKGRPVVYCAPNPATALLEILVNLEVDEDDFPSSYRLLMIEATDTIAVTTVESDKLPRNWRQDFSHTRALGDDWLRTGETPLLAVPCAIVPETNNYLLNPLHADSSKVHVVRPVNYDFDARLRR